MQLPQALANGASQGPELSAHERNDVPLLTVFSVMLLPTTERFSRVPSMFDSLGVKVPYPT